MPNLLKKTENIVMKIEKLQQFISNMMLLFMMSIITLDVLGRNFLNKPLKGTFEMTELGSALLVFFALAITHRHGGHISIDFLVDLLHKKTQNIIQGIIELIISTVVLFMSWHIFSNGLRFMDRKTTTTDLGLSVHPFLFIITFTLVLLAITSIFKAVNYFRMAVVKDES